MDYQKICYSIAYNIHGRLKPDGTALLCIVARQGQKRTHYSTGIHIAPTQWNSRSRLIVNHIFADSYNIMIREKIIALQQIEIDIWKKDIMPTLHLQKQLYKGAKNVVRDKNGNVQLVVHHDFKEFVNKYIIHGGNRKKITKKGYKCFVAVIEDYIGSVAIEQIDYDFICGFDRYLRNKRRNTTSTIRQAHNRLRAVLHEAVIRDFIEKNPYDKFRIPYENKQRHAISYNAIRKIEEYERNTSDLFSAQFLFAIYTGLRYSDQKALTSSNIITSTDEDGHEDTMLKLSTSKTQYHINIPLNLLFGGRAVALIEKYRITKLANLQSASTVNKKVKVLMKKLNVKEWESISWHIARHTTATWLNKLSVPVTTVQRILGHKKINTTMLYTETTQDILQNELRKSCTKMNG